MTIYDHVYHVREEINEFIENVQTNNKLSSEDVFVDAKPFGRTILRLAAAITRLV